MDRSNALTALICIPVSFFAGVIVARIFPDGGDVKLMIDLGVAIGTISAVLVALTQGIRSRRESSSRAYREAALSHLQTATDSFLTSTEQSILPPNTRRHWLNFARAIQVARNLASRIELDEQREIWVQQEGLLRQLVFDALNTTRATFAKEYYLGPRTPVGAPKSLPISEPSLVIIYQWIDWPKDLADPIDRFLKFSEAERENMRLFGPKGVAAYLDEQQSPKAS